MWKRFLSSLTLRLGLLLSVWGAFAGRAVATPDLRFDVVTFCCNCGGSLLCQPQFDHLNIPSLNGHYIAMGSDAYRTNLLAIGNLLAVYYNNFDSDSSSTNTAAQEAAAIDQYSTSLFTTTGPKPNWIVLNEISSGLWPTNQAYRTWVEGVVHLLRMNYGYTVIVYAPFPNPANNSADWQIVSADAYIAVENYLSGQQIAAQNFSVNWCQNQYQSSIASYNSVGVPPSRLILGEHFGQTVVNTGYGRSGVSSNSWDSAITARDQAALDAGFAGFISFDWGGDNLGVSEDEMISYEDVYAGDPLPSAEILTPPFPALQPQPQTAPPGSTVNFNIIPAGDAPVAYQWYFNGVQIPGRTAGALTLTNISPETAGSYSVLLKNAAGTTWSSNALLLVQTPPPLVFEPFAEAAGANLIGQTNAQGLAWFQAGPASALANQPVIQSGNLLIPGLTYSSGNSVAFGGGGGMAARCQIFTNSSGLTTGTVYFSFALKLTNIAGLSSTGVFWAGFNNSGGSQTTTPTVVATRIYTRATGGGFNLGLSKASSATSDWQWDTTVHLPNETLFIVGSYTFNATPGNDSASLWINPAPSTLGVTTPPAPTLVASSGPNISSSIIDSFLLMNRDATEPAGAIVDELRIGASWASVTPPISLFPTLNISPTPGGIVLSWPTNAEGFHLTASQSLSASNWTNMPLPVSVVGSQYAVTNPLPAVPEYFRLQQP